MTIIEQLRSMPDYIGSNGRTDAEIESAEKAIRADFSEDYRRYLKEIGLACYDGHELTGITTSSRLDVVAVTIAERDRSGADTSKWYVLEETGIDGIVIWQSSSGGVYQTSPGNSACKIANSLLEYVSGDWRV